MNNINDLLDNTNILYNKILNIFNIKDKKKQNIYDDVIPFYDDCFLLLKYKFKVSELRRISKYYKLKINGNKNELLSKLFVFLYLSKYACKIQKVIRGYITRLYFKLKGPALNNRKLCTNDIDFLSMDSVYDISFNQFFSFKDENNFIYGFDILSFYNLISQNKNKDYICNPFTSTIIKNKVLSNFKKLIRISKILGLNVNITLDKTNTNISKQTTLESKVVKIFLLIDELGNYSNISWFMDLNIFQLIRMIKELIDVWNYRAPLSTDVKINICPPHGNPFQDINIFRIENITNIDNVRYILLDIMEKLLSGNNRDSKSLGAYYILGTLTLVNKNAADSIPWLYQAFVY